MGIHSPYTVIQVQLYGYELRLEDAERSFRNLLTLSLSFPEYKVGGKVAQAGILVVDDDPDIRQALQLRLRANGYDVHCAEDGTGAISQASKYTPDLIVLDLGLPSGDGFVVLDTLKANLNLSSIPVIVLSGRDRRANEERVLNAGAKVFLPKPVQTNEFLAVVRQTLDEKRQKSGGVHDLDHPGTLRV
jgi:DNA-binding response OmpR family regulator